MTSQRVIFRVFFAPPPPPPDPKSENNSCKSSNENILAYSLITLGHTHRVNYPSDDKDG